MAPELSPLTRAAGTHIQGYSLLRSALSHSGYKFLLCPSPPEPCFPLPVIANNQPSFLQNYLPGLSLTLRLCQVKFNLLDLWLFSLLISQDSSLLSNRFLSKWHLSTVFHVLYSNKREFLSTADKKDHQKCNF